VKINNKIKILNVNKLKLFLQNDETEESQTFMDYNFNDKLIKYKEAAQLALLMLNDLVNLRLLTLCAVNDVHPVTLKMTILN
jgi:hypothetical protein